MGQTSGFGTGYPGGWNPSPKGAPGPPAGIPSDGGRRPIGGVAAPPTTPTNPGLNGPSTGYAWGGNIGSFSPNVPPVGAVTVVGGSSNDGNWGRTPVGYQPPPIPDPRVNYPISTQPDPNVVKPAPAPQPPVQTKAPAQMPPTSGSESGPAYGPGYQARLEAQKKALALNRKNPGPIR